MFIDISRNFFEPLNELILLPTHQELHNRVRTKISHSTYKVILRVVFRAGVKLA